MHYFSKDLIWWRPFGGRGICIKRTKPLFSERNGYSKTYRLGFGWRLAFLPKLAPRIDPHA